MWALRIPRWRMVLPWNKASMLRGHLKLKCSLKCAGPGRRPTGPSCWERQGLLLHQARRGFERRWDLDRAFVRERHFNKPWMGGRATQQSTQQKKRHRLWTWGELWGWAHENPEGEVKVVVTRFRQQDVSAPPAMNAFAPNVCGSAHPLINLKPFPQNHSPLLF